MISPLVVTREVNNQLGKDANLEATEVKIKSFDIHRQRERKTFHRRDGYMSVPSNESNFYPFSDYQLQ